VKQRQRQQVSMASSAQSPTPTPPRLRNPPTPPNLTPTPVASLTVLSTDQAHYVTLGAVGSCTAAVAQPILAYPLAGSGSSLETAILQLSGSGANNASNAAANAADGGGGGGSAIVSWRASGDGYGPSPPMDWHVLASAGLRAIYGVCIRGGPKEQLLGMLNIGFTDARKEDVQVGGGGRLVGWGRGWL